MGTPYTMSIEADHEPSTEPGGGCVDVAPDVAFELLSDSCRRIALRCLLDHDGPMAVEELVSAVVAAGDETDGAAARHRQVKIALHHVHLPKLGDAGVVEYHRATGVVAPTATTDGLAPLLEQCEQQWRR